MTSTLDPDVEYVVLCGERHERVGYVPKAEVHHSRTPLHLAFSCYLFDERGHLLITWRARSKRTWPGVRTNSCCGHPGPGERLPDAIARRLTDELGVTAERVDLVLPEFSYEATMSDGVRENEVCPVYRATVTSRPQANPNPDEVDDTAWVDWASFVAEVDADRTSVSPWCALQVDQLRTLGPDPLAWPVADDTRLPSAAREPLEDPR
ncbi:isopentenyl-diphosphate Delta-isomerase [Saccharomonospora piscinae]|uniref:Isopentenyl-diphosphate Delta-isomerase n=1 Tax=Saccharomonospora piscinae TaxID=687388 RepID=A0A1V9A798_SACPI|nr:isopentenyl-diphosphate Delta-isomerase [Saccharomonospora piscinae]OQO93009.1 isopentenyl-diphosphate Delta-isomerase [Saccharomonospora piscinae]TLW93150.1 isopentenyl-diphosphate Delta-isomerase [Saccharomonospora piscinae]